MIADLSLARGRWATEKPEYEALCRHVQSRLEHELREQGLLCTVTGRSKDTGDLLKKLVKKGYSYDEITDKAGVRVVVRFREEVGLVGAIVERSFRVIKKEDKAQNLGHNEVGYQAVHYDVLIPPQGDSLGTSSLLRPQVEIQVRSLCQDLWAVIDHELSYKPAQPVPEDLKRQIYLLNAMLELADRSFSDIRDTIRRMPGAEAMEVLQTLERHFYRMGGTSYDPELSTEVLDFLQGLYARDEVPRLTFILDQFVQDNGAKLKRIYEQYQHVEDRPLFLFQPEVIVILERLERDPHLLEDFWVRKYPGDELRRLSVVWGRPLD